MSTLICTNTESSNMFYVVGRRVKRGKKNGGKNNKWNGNKKKKIHPNIRVREKIENISFAIKISVFHVYVFHFFTIFFSSFNFWSIYYFIYVLGAAMGLSELYWFGCANADCWICRNARVDTIVETIEVFDKYGRKWTKKRSISATIWFKKKI